MKHSLGSVCACTPAATAQDDIVKVRDASTQTERIGVPEEHLGGHAFHTYRRAFCDCAVMSISVQRHLLVYPAGDEVRP